jgi:hypothetical protein
MKCHDCGSGILNVPWVVVLAEALYVKEGKIFLGVGQYWVLRASCLLDRALPFEPLHQSFFVLGIFKIGSLELFGVVLNFNPYDRCLSSS